MAWTPALTTVGSVGKLLVDNVNATISSRAAQTTADAIETDTQDIQSRLPATLSSGRIRADAEAISASTTAADAVEANIANLDAAVSSRATPAQVNTEADTALADAGVTTIRLAKLDGLPEGIKKNTALADFEFFMAQTADHVTGATGLTVTAQRSIDGGAFAGCTNSPTELSGGFYVIDLSAADLNGTVITLLFTAATADATGITIKTTP